ncbi:MAG: tyrosine recombinase XerC [Clostridia bacterium]|nr:tyrosine recombinase XerC [Clostridia bacterium]
MDRATLNATAPILRDFLVYSETIKGKATKTIEQYYLDLTLFFKFLKLQRGLVSEGTDFSDIIVNDIDEDMMKSVTMTDLYAFIVYCKNERSNGAAARARKVSALRVFFKYLTNNVHLLKVNPAAELDTPKLKKSLPVHLSLEQSIDLLKSVDGPHKERDFCILTLFLNCGMRLSELCSLNYTDIREDGSLKITGKGNKERVIYLNEACMLSVRAYMQVRPNDGVAQKDKNALFLSARKQRISNKTVQHIVYTFLDKAGLGGQGFSAHKLRHTAATLMYQMGGVDIRVLKDVLGHENLGTTQIYTHVANRQVEEAFNKNPLSGVKPTINKNNINDENSNEEDS